MSKGQNTLPVATEEQAAILAASAFAPKQLVANALAGTGKSTLLKLYAHTYSKRRISYVAFNTALALEARKTMPPNVEAETIHKRASDAYGAITEHKRTNNLSLVKVCEVFGLSVDSQGDYAHLVLEHLNRYMASAAEAPADLPVPPSAQAAAARLGRSFVNDVGDLFLGMLDPKNLAIPATHDSYLKEYQLRRPVWNTDVVLCDEWQDANAVTSAIVQAQEANILYVGDRHQSIYGFRYAVDAMDALSANSKAYYLSKSFRFGPEIARVANTILAFKSEKQQVIGAGGQDRLGRVDANKSYAFISRSNEGIFEYAAAAIDRAPGVRLHFIGGGEGYRLPEVLDVYTFATGGRPNSRLLQKFKSIDSLEAHAHRARDVETLSCLRLVSRFGSRIPSLVNAMLSAQTEKAEAADIILVTAHKSKGLEFEQVKLDDNFISLTALLGDLRRAGQRATSIAGFCPDPQEVNLLYVAATRAKAVLEPNADLASVVDRMQGKQLFGGPTLALPAQPKTSGVFGYGQGLKTSVPSLSSQLSPSASGSSKRPSLTSLLDVYRR